MRPSWSYSYRHTRPSGTLPWMCLSRASAALVARSLHCSRALASPHLTTEAPSWDLALPKWMQITSYLSLPSPISVVTLHHLTCSCLLCYSVEHVLWEKAVTKYVNTQGSWRAVKYTNYSKQTREKDYLCKAFWLLWFQVVLIVTVAIIYFYFFALLTNCLLISPHAPPLHPQSGASLVLYQTSATSGAAEKEETGSSGLSRTPVPWMSRLPWRYPKTFEQLWNNTWGAVIRSGACCSKGFMRRENSGKWYGDLYLCGWEETLEELQPSVSYG